jgi:hypothetical protein
MTKEVKLNKPYNFGAYNVCGDVEQWIRITEGCPNDCPYCAEPKEYRIFPIPEIERNTVKIMDMNLLAKKQAWDIIDKLSRARVNGKVVYYELICGIDYRFLTAGLASLLKESRFKNIRVAWDWWMKSQYKIKDALKMLFDAGYKPKEIMIFMICNWKIPQAECLRKLDLLKVWGVKVSDCYFDGQVFPKVKPIHWTLAECKEFRRLCRKHNQLVTFGIDPEVKLGDKNQKEFAEIKEVL